jgi:hypothetical protein
VPYDPRLLPSTFLGPLRRLLAAGAVPRPDDAGSEELIVTKLALRHAARVAIYRSDGAAAEVLLKAGLLALARIDRTKDPHGRWSADRVDGDGHAIDGTPRRGL